MNDIFSENIYTLEKMGYEVKQFPEINEVRIILRSKREFGFTLNVRYYDLQDEEIITIIVRTFNNMVTNKIGLVE